MGNCCGGGEEQTSSQPATQAFQGRGHRLGEAHEVTPLSGTQSGGGKANDLPPPQQDPNMTSAEREQQRLERLAAAEARQKKAGGPPKKKKVYKDVPLTGPNSKPAMTWTAG